MQKRLFGVVMIIGMLVSGCTAEDAAMDVAEETAVPSPSASAEAEAPAVVPSAGNADGAEGDRMKTEFFDFTVNESQVLGSYQGISPDSGKNLLRVSMTIHNTTDDSIEMFDTDFQAQWGDEDSAAYAVPVTYETDLSADGMLATQYTLHSNQKITGDLVFEVPSDASAYELCYEEVFEDGTTGDTFFVTLSPAE